MKLKIALTRATTLGMLLTLATMPVAGQAADQEPADDMPWWRQKKIVFMWGQWNTARVDKSVDYWIGEPPRAHFRHVARAGGTVFAEATGMVKGHACRPAHARHAREFGLKYVATRYIGLPRYRVGPDDSGRPWVSERGEEPGGAYNCTLEHDAHFVTTGRVALAVAHQVVWAGGFHPGPNPEPDLQVSKHPALQTALIIGTLQRSVAHRRNPLRLVIRSIRLRTRPSC